MSHEIQLKQIEYRNWVKGGLTFRYFKDGVNQYVEFIVLSEHTRILQQTGVRHGQICTACSFRDLKPVHKKQLDPITGRSCCPWAQKSCNCLFPAKKRKCPMKICDFVYEEVLKTHASTPPSPEWRNTDITKWTTSPWEIAKCYINAPGYSDKQSAAEIDITGLLHVFINNVECHKYFQNVKVKEFVKIRERRHSLFHSPSMTLETAELNLLINDLINILQDGNLKSSTDAISAVQNLKELDNKDFHITTQSEADTFKTGIEEISKEMEKLKDIIEDARQDFLIKQDQVVKRICIAQENASKDIHSKHEQAIKDIRAQREQAIIDITSRQVQVCTDITTKQEEVIKCITSIHEQVRTNITREYAAKDVNSRQEQAISEIADSYRDKLEDIAELKRNHVDSINEGMTSRAENAADLNFTLDQRRTQPYLVQGRLGGNMDRNYNTMFCDRFHDCCPEKVYLLRDSLRKDVKQTYGEILSLQHYRKYLAVIPPLNRVSEEVGVMFKDKYVDLAMMNVLERSEVLNWCRATKELFPIQTTADGNCLLHAISQGMWGIEDTEYLLRRVVYTNLVTDAKDMFKKRWLFHHRRFQISWDLQRVDMRLNSEDFCEEWEAVIKATDDVSKSKTHGLPYTALESIHLYVSANMLKRPIIVIADPMARPIFGQTIQDSQISGVYLPLEWSPEQCHKSPIVIGYNMNHFAPLLFEDATGVGSNDTSIQAVPLVTKAMDSLPIRFLIPIEEMNIRNILSDYLHTTEVFFNTTPVPAVQVKTHPLTSTLNVLEACLLDCERKFQRLRGEEVSAVIPQNEIMMLPFQSEVSNRGTKPATSADQRLNDVPIRDRHSHEHGGDRKKCVTISCDNCADPETQNLWIQCFKNFTTQYARQKETARRMTGLQPFVPAQWIPSNQPDPLGIPRPQPPARHGFEHYQDLSIMAEDCHDCRVFKCSVETYPYCHVCYQKYNTSQQSHLEPPRQVESSNMPGKYNNPACKYRCSKATFPYCHACFNQFVAQPNVPPTAPPPSVPGILAAVQSQAATPGFSTAHTAHDSAGRSPQLSNETYSALQLTPTTTALSNNQQQNKRDLEVSGWFPYCSPVPLSKEEMKILNYVDLSYGVNVECASPNCDYLTYPPNKLCDKCATDLEKFKAKSKNENLRSVGALGKQCNTIGCKFYGLSDFNGYCFTCYKA